MSHIRERRHHPRVPVTAGDSTKPNILSPCRIIDISLGGLAFCYTGPEKWPEKADSWAKLIFGEDELCLDSLPLRTVSDQIMAHERISRLPALRRRGVQFGPLLPYQHVMLRYFIWLKSLKRRY